MQSTPTTPRPTTDRTERLAPTDYAQLRQRLRELPADQRAAMSAPGPSGPVVDERA